MEEVKIYFENGESVYIEDVRTVTTTAKQIIITKEMVYGRESVLTFNLDKIAGYMYSRLS